MINIFGHCPFTPKKIIPIWVPHFCTKKKDTFLSTDLLRQIYRRIIGVLNFNHDLIIINCIKLLYLDII